MIGDSLHRLMLNAVIFFHLRSLNISDLFALRPRYEQTFSLLTNLVGQLTKPCPVSRTDSRKFVIAHYNNVKMVYLYKFMIYSGALLCQV